VLIEGRGAFEGWFTHCQHGSALLFSHPNIRSLLVKTGIHPSFSNNRQAIRASSRNAHFFNISDCAVQNNTVLLGTGGGISLLGGDSSILRTQISGNRAYQGGGLAFAGNECQPDDEDCQLASLSIPRSGGTRIFGNSAVLSGGGVLVQAWRNTTADPEEVAAAASGNQAFSADDVAMPPLALSWPKGQPTDNLDDYVSRVQRWQGVLPLAVRVTGPSSASVMGVRLQAQVQPSKAGAAKPPTAAKPPAVAKPLAAAKPQPIAKQPGGRSLLQMLQYAKARAAASKSTTSTTSTTGVSTTPLPRAAAVSSSNVTLLGAEAVSNAAGIANFSTVQFKVRAPPGQYVLTIVAPDYPEVGSLSTTLTIRSCVDGEVQGNSGDTCEVCATETWSRNPDNATCDACVPHTVCKGSSLSPDAGYWHSAPESVQVHPCPNAEACSKGGQCAAGYEGPMCSVCMSGYGRRSSLSCAKCLGSRARGVLFAVGCIALLLMVAWTAHSAWTTNNNSAALVTAASLPGAANGKATDDGTGGPPKEYQHHLPTSTSAYESVFAQQHDMSRFSSLDATQSADQKVLPKLPSITQGAKLDPADSFSASSQKSGGLSQRRSFLKSGSSKYIIPPDALPAPPCSFELLKILVRFLQYLLIIFTAQAPWPSSWRVTASALALLFSTFTSALGLDCMLPSESLEPELPVAARAAIAQEALPFALFVVMTLMLTAWYFTRKNCANTGCFSRRQGLQTAIHQRQPLGSFLKARLPTLALVSFWSGHFLGGGQLLAYNDHPFLLLPSQPSPSTPNSNHPPDHSVCDVPQHDARSPPSILLLPHRQKRARHPLRRRHSRRRCHGLVLGARHAPPVLDRLALALGACLWTAPGDCARCGCAPGPCTHPAHLPQAP